MNYLIANGRCKVHLLRQGENFFGITNFSFSLLFAFTIFKDFSSFCTALFFTPFGCDCLCLISDVIKFCIAEGPRLYILGYNM